MEPEQTATKLTVPLAIIAAGILIAGAVFFSRAPTPGENTGSEKVVTPSSPPTTTVSVRGLDTKDHVKGNPTADIVIIEYSDTECPFCKRFHQTLQQIIDEYGKSGKVAWVYRHFPLEQLHSKARKEAEATECAAELGGNNGFWSFTDELMRVTPSNDGLSPAELPNIAGRIGLNRASFEACLSSGRQGTRVQGDYQEAVTSGGAGTPWSVIALKQKLSDRAQNTLSTLFATYRDQQDEPLVRFTADGTRIIMSGAMPYTVLKATIEEVQKN